MFRHNILAVMAIAITGMSSCVSAPQIYKGENDSWKNVLYSQAGVDDEQRKKDAAYFKDEGIVRYPKNENPYENGISYARTLADYYIQQAGYVSQGKDAVALGLIATAGVATGGLLYDANVNLIKGAGLAAGSLTVLNNYANSEEAETGLLAASEALICIADVAESATKLNSDPVAQGALYDAILRVRMNVRKKISRKVIDYGTLLDDYKVAGKDVRSFSGDNDKRADELAALKDRLKTCQLRTGA